MKKHVLLVVQNNSFPTDKRVAKEARSLKEAGYFVSAISPAFGDDQLRRDSWEGIDIYRYHHFESTGGLPGFVLEYANAVIRIFFISLGLFIRKPFKSIHVANPPDFFWPMALFYKLFSVRFIFDQHDISPEMYRINEGKDKNLIYNVLLWCEKLTVKCSSGIITTNESIKDRLEEMYGLGHRPCAVVYNGPNASFLPKLNQQLVDKYKEKKVILYIGEMAVVDSIDAIIEVAEELVLKRECTECRFVLVGDGPERERLVQMASKKGLSDYVEFTGRVTHDQVMEYLYVSTIGVAPDRVNGLNEFLTLIKSLEYLKAAKPFVAFDLKETRNIAGVCALYAKDLNEYVEHVAWLLDHPTEACEMGRRGEQRMTKDFLWQGQADKMVALYREVLGESVLRTKDRRSED